MKNGKCILLLVIALSVFLVLGVFIGRNMNSGHVFLSADNAVTETPIPHERIDYRLDINTATKSQLMELPGIGEVMADRIIAYRAENGFFSSIDGLLEIEGIGAKKLQQIEKLITVGG